MQANQTNSRLRHRKNGEIEIVDRLDCGDPHLTLAAAILMRSFEDLHRREPKEFDRRDAERFTNSRWFYNICDGLELDADQWRTIILEGQLN